jgi:hypothetical protein
MVAAKDSGGNSTQFGSNDGIYGVVLEVIACGSDGIGEWQEASEGACQGERELQGQGDRGAMCTV